VFGSENREKKAQKGCMTGTLGLVTGVTTPTVTHTTKIKGGFEMVSDGLPVTACDARH